MGIKNKKPPRTANFGPGPELGIQTPVENVNAPCWLYTHLYGWVLIGEVTWSQDLAYQFRFKEPVYDGETIGFIEGAFYQPGESVIIRTEDLPR